MIQIDGIIGLDVTARDIRAQLEDAGDEVEILINSPGGSVTEGVSGSAWRITPRS